MIRLDSKVHYYVDIRFNVHYDEYIDDWEPAISSFIYRKHLALTNDTIRIPLPEDQFLPKLANSIPDKPQVYSRRFRSIDIIFLAADKNFRDYINSYENASDRDVTLWGNFTNTMGLFSLASSVVRTGYVFDSSTMDSLCTGRFTKNLRFNRW